MAQTDQRRSGSSGVQSLGTAAEAAGHGVGGRQGVLPMPLPGGGYLHECTASASPVGRKNRRAAVASPGRFAHDGDPRLDELRRFGLSNAWMRVARRVGYEAFLAMWLELASDESVLDDRSRIVVPSPSRYARYQQVLFVRQLGAEGVEPAEIVERVRRTLGRSIALQYVRNLLRPDSRIWACQRQP